MPPKLLAKAFSLWPPYLGAGIKIDYISKDWRKVKVSMKLSSKNRNYVGTHFGGSLYSMVDPFYMLMLIKNLGNKYIVWDKSASINFKQPGKGTVHASFQISELDIKEIKEKVDERGKLIINRFVEIKNDAQELVAEVDKQIYIRRK